jgi:hypothetical protein
MKRIEVILSVVLVLMGTIDCVTTVIGVMFSGASEANPIMAGIVSSNIDAFMVIKIVATALIAFTYLYASKLLMKSANKAAASFKVSRNLLNIGYIGIIGFLFVVVANNLMVLLA